MIIEIPKIPPDGVTYRGEEPPEVLGLGEGADLEAAGPLGYDLFVSIASRRLLVRGTVRMPLRTACARCADLFSTTPCDSSFLRVYPLKDEQVTVDITDDLREAVLLQVPSHPLCRPDCAGLCPRCGQNRNEGTCRCRADEEAGAWSPLRDLDLPPPEQGPGR